MTPAFHRSTRAVAVPLAGMLFTQTSAVMSLVTVPVLATEIAAETGLGASKVGLYTSLIFGAAMFTSAASGGVIQRLGPVRTNQVALVFSATALLLTLTANPWWIALSAMLIGGIQSGSGSACPDRCRGYGGGSGVPCNSRRRASRSAARASAARRAVAASSRAWSASS